MQKLHLVGFTADFEGLIFSTRKGAKSGSFVVPIDARLLKQIADAEKRREGGPSPDEDGSKSPRLVRPESSLSPREMQHRIRAGWSVDEVAAEAGVDLDWVRRFASPVLAEVRRVLEDARGQYYDKPRVGLSTLPLGASVRRNVFERGVRMTDDELEDCWSAYQLDDAIWILRFSYLSRGRMQEAEWRYDIETEEVSSYNRLASQLGHVTKRRPRKAAAVAPAKPRKPTPKTVKAHKEAQAAKAAIAKQSPAPPRRRAAANGAAPPRASARRRAPSAKKSASSSKKPAKKRAPAPVEATSPALAPARRATVDVPTWRPTPMPVAASRPSVPAPVAAAAVRPVPLPVARPAPVPDPVRPRPRPVPPPSEAPVERVEPVKPIERVERVEPVKRPAAERRPPPPPPPPPAPPPRAPERAETPAAGVPPESASGWDVIKAGASPALGDGRKPPRPGAIDVDPETGIAHIDSRRMWHQPASAARTPVFRDVTMAGDDSPPPASPSRSLRPRRTEPLRGR